MLIPFGTESGGGGPLARRPGSTKIVKSLTSAVHSLLETLADSVRVDYVHFGEEFRLVDPRFVPRVYLVESESTTVAAESVLPRRLDRYVNQPVSIEGEGS